MAIVRGLENVLKNLRKTINSIVNSSDKAMMKVALRIEADSNEYVPKKFGVLVNSSFATFHKIRRKAEVGYAANYVGYVHEMPEDYNFTSPGTGPKFLQRAIDQNSPDIVSDIQKGIKSGTGIRFRIR